MSQTAPFMFSSSSSKPPAFKLFLCPSNRFKVVPLVRLAKKTFFPQKRFCLSYKHFLMFFPPKETPQTQGYLFVGRVFLSRPPWNHRHFDGKSPPTYKDPPIRDFGRSNGMGQVPYTPPKAPP